MSDQQSATSGEEPTDPEDVLPGPLGGIYAYWSRVDAFREAHGDTYVGVLEAITAAILVGGYVYWLYLFFVAG
mgnify:CR=1 FL=1